MKLHKMLIILLHLFCFGCVYISYIFGIVQCKLLKSSSSCAQYFLYYRNRSMQGIKIIVTLCPIFPILSESTPFIQIQQTWKGLPNTDINNCIARIHKVREHKQTAFKFFLYKMCLCRADAKWYILSMVQHHSKRFV